MAEKEQKQYEAKSNMRPFKSKSNSKCKWFIQLIEIVRLGLKINTSLGFIEKKLQKA